MWIFFYCPECTRLRAILSECKYQKGIQTPGQAVRTCAGVRENFFPQTSL
jgi:hypothetical protein